MIETKDGFLGRFHDENTPDMVKIGFEQSMVYAPDDLGSFELKPTEKENRWHDKIVMIPVHKQKPVNFSKNE